MFTMLLVFCAAAWTTVGVLFVHIAQLRQTNKKLDSEIDKLEYRLDCVSEDLECTEESLAHETHLATRMMDERDAAHKCLELLLSDENLKELTK